jgi:hypothetical protein
MLSIFFIWWPGPVEHLPMIVNRTKGPGQGRFPPAGHPVLLILPSGFRLLRHRQGIRSDLNPPHFEPIFAVFHGILRGARNYRPEPIRADILAVRAAERTVSEFFDQPDRDLADWGGRQFTRGAVRCRTMPGNHYGLLSGGNVEIVAEAIQREMTLANEHQAQ